MFSEVLKRVGLDEIWKNPVDLMQAIKYQDLEGIIACFGRDQPFNIKDKQGNNVLHIAVRTGNRTLVRCICVFTPFLDLWNQKNSEDKTPIDVAEDPSIRRDLQLISTPRSAANSYHIDFNKFLVTRKLQEENKAHYRVLLSLDGGGIRVLLQSSILMHIEHMLGEPLRQHVHWIGGTSCGGIMGCTLACGLSMSDARKVYLAQRKRIFCGNHAIFPKHSPAGIESVLKQVMGPKTTIGNIKAHRVVVTAARVQFAPPQLCLFRSYAPRLNAQKFEQLGYLNPDKIILWKAIRCTSAAPVYFSSFNGMADGAIFCNNPTIMLMTEFSKLKKIENYWGVKNTDDIGCVLSIGTGTEPSVPINGIDINMRNTFGIGGNIREILGNGRNLITLFMYQCTTSHNVHVGQSREWAHSLGIPFFRFSPRLSASFELDTTKVETIFDAMFETEVYIKTQIQSELSDLCRLLKALPKNTEPCEYTKITR